jgi:hypothetical protein
MARKIEASAAIAIKAVQRHRGEYLTEPQQELAHITTSWYFAINLIIIGAGRKGFAVAESEPTCESEHAQPCT